MQSHQNFQPGCTFPWDIKLMGFRQLSRRGAGAGGTWKLSRYPAPPPRFTILIVTFNWTTTESNARNQTGSYKLAARPWNERGSREILQERVRLQFIGDYVLRGTSPCPWEEIFRGALDTRRGRGSFRGKRPTGSWDFVVTAIFWRSRLIFRRNVRENWVRGRFLLRRVIRVRLNCSLSFVG